MWQEIEENLLLPPKSTKHVKSAIALNCDRSPHNSRSDKIAKVANYLKIICVDLRCICGFPINQKLMQLANQNPEILKGYIHLKKRDKQQKAPVFQGAQYFVIAQNINPTAPLAMTCEGLLHQLWEYP